MKKKALILGLLGALGIFTGCTAGSTIGNSGEAVYEKINPEQAKNMMDDGQPYILIDVRTDEEFKENHIDGAILIPDYDIGTLVEEKVPDKDARILVYCRSGRRSALAAMKMVDLGYTDVYDFGGIIDWPYETVGK